MELRSYQEDCLEAVRESLIDHLRVLLEAPTGAGKTVMASWMCDAVTSMGERAYFLCHRRELIQQTAMTFAEVGIDFGVVSAGWEENLERPVQICSIQTLARRLDRVPPPHLLMLDEAHHVAAKSWSQVIEAWSDAFVVGLSATPCRHDGRGLDDWFHDLILGPSVAWLIEQGWLSKYRLFAPSVPDLKSVRTARGDYESKALAQAMDQGDLIGNIVDHQQQHAAGRKTMVFATNCAHSRHIVDRFNAVGISAIHVDGTTPRDERGEALRGYAMGKYEVISNVELFGEGFDLSANAGVPCTIECVISARPTQSLAIWLQQVGRALRPKPEPAIILDHAGNALRHGLPDEPREWTLEGRKRTRREVEETPVSIRQCPECFAVHHRILTKCPECDHSYRVAQQQEMIQERGGELVELKRRPGEPDKRYKKRQVQRARTYEDLYALGVSRGYKKPAAWAEHILAAREAKRPGVAS